MKLSIYEHASENIVCLMAAILSRGDELKHLLSVQWLLRQLYNQYKYPMIQCHACKFAATQQWFNWFFARPSQSNYQMLLSLTRSHLTVLDKYLPVNIFPWISLSVGLVSGLSHSLQNASINFSYRVLSILSTFRQNKNRSYIKSQTFRVIEAQCRLNVRVPCYQYRISQCKNKSIWESTMGTALLGEMLCTSKWGPGY